MRVLNQRILTFVCFFVMLGIYCAYQFKLNLGQAVWLYLILGATAVLYTVFTKRFILSICLIALCVGNFLFINKLYTNFDGIESGTWYTITGRVSEYPEKSSVNTRYMLGDVKISGKGTSIDFGKRVQLSAPNDTFRYGDILTFESMVYPPRGETMPGTFNSQIYLAGRNAGFSAYSDDVRKVGYQWTPFELFVNARAALEYNIDQMYSPQAAPVAKAIFLGLQDEIPDNLYSSFSQTGITHILSISGLHISVIALLLNVLLKKTRLKRDWRYILNIVLLLLYTSITGFPVSVVRASLMTILFLIGSWRFFERDTLLFLSAAMLATLLFDPAQLFMPGFLLSYGTVFGILCLYPPLKRLIQNKNTETTNGMGEMLCVSAAATAASAPMTAYYFNNIALIAPLANFYAIPVSSLIVVFTGLSALLSLIAIRLGQFFAVISESLIKFLIILNQFVSETVGGYIRIARFPVWIGIAVFAAIFIASDYFMVKAKVKAVILASVFSAVYVLNALPFSPAGLTTINFLDVGNGEAVHIQYADPKEPEKQKNILITNATSSAAYNVNSYTNRNGIVFDLFILTEGSHSHMSGALSIIQNGGVKGSFAYTDVNSDITEASNAKGISMHPVQKYDTLWKDNGIEITVLQSNYNALTLLISKNGRNLSLLSGHSAGRSKDIRVSAPVLRVSSEGGKSSLNQSFLQTVAPKYAIISEYQNSYGLPDPSTLKQLTDAGIKIYRTDLNYSIIMTADEAGNITMRPMNED